MPHVLLILLAGGVLFGSALPNRRTVRPAALRWAAALSVVLACAGAVVAGLTPREGPDPPAFFRRVQAGLVGLTVALAIASFIVVMLRPAARARRALCVAAFLVAVLAGSNLLHDAMLPRGTAVAYPPKGFSMALQTLSCAGAAAVPGVALGYALLLSLAMTDRVDSADASRRVRRALLGLLAARAAMSVSGVLLLARLATAPRAAPGDWDPGSAAARWLLGIVVPALFAAVAGREAARATSPRRTAAMLWVAGLCAIAGEALALGLVRDTGLPF